MSVANAQNSVPCILTFYFRYELSILDMSEVGEAGKLGARGWSSTSLPNILTHYF